MKSFSNVYRCLSRSATVLGLCALGLAGTADADEKRLPAGMLPMVSLDAHGISFNIWYMDIIDDSDTGFDDTDTGAAAQASLHETLDYIGNVLNVEGTLDVFVDSSEFDGGVPVVSDTLYPTSPAFRMGPPSSALKPGQSISPASRRSR